MAFAVAVAPDVESFMGGVEVAVIVSVPVLVVFLGVRVVRRYLGV